MLLSCQSAQQHSCLHHLVLLKMPSYDQKQQYISPGPLQWFLVTCLSDDIPKPENLRKSRERAGAQLHLLQWQNHVSPSTLPFPDLSVINPRAYRKETSPWIKGASDICLPHNKNQNKSCTNLMARKASLYARSASWGSRAENRYLAKVCIGTLSRWITSPKPLKGPPTSKSHWPSLSLIHH